MLFASGLISKARHELPPLHNQPATVQRDLTRIYAAERARREELELAHQALSAIFANTPDGLVVLDNAGIIQQANPAFCQWFGSSPEVLVGQPIAEILHSDQLLKAITQLATDVAAPTRVELTLVYPVKRVLLAHIAQLKAGHIEGWIINFHDQSMRRRLEHQKMEFINIAAHELRTPLAAVIGFAELLQYHLAGQLSVTDEECLNGVLNAAQRLKNIINELIDFAHLNQGDLSSRGVHEFPLANLVADVFAEVQERANRYQVCLDMQGVDPAIHMVVDATLLRSALIQLVLNGISFNRTGGSVAIAAETHANQVTISITDTGIGIDPAQIDAIFQPFYQIEDYHIRRVGGLGLGLSIASRSVAQLGGTLTITNTSSAGTTLQLSLPLRQPTPEAALADLQSQLAASFQQARAYAHDAHTLYQQLQQHSLATLAAITQALEARDTYTRGHSERVTLMALAIARHLGYSERELSLLEIAGLIHDIGMIGISDALLNKTDQLTEEESALLRQHVELGRSIVAPLEFLRDVLPRAFAHHERWDGQGYPNGLAGEAIPLDSRILAVADAYDALISPRPYREAMSSTQAVAIIQAGAGSQWDPTVVQAFLAVMQATSSTDAPHE